MSNNEQKLERGPVTVFGDNVLQAPLIDSSSVDRIVVRDVDRNPILVLIRYAGDTWIISTIADEDFKNVLERYTIR